MTARRSRPLFWWGSVSNDEYTHPWRITRPEAWIMAKLSAGLLMYRWRDVTLEVFLVHPGGPFWARKDDGAWSIPKGEYTEGDDPLAAARREFTEETGFTPEGDLIPLSSIKQPSGKAITVWALEGDCDASRCHSNNFSLEWPPKSGQMQEFPEVD